MVGWLVVDTLVQCGGWIYGNDWERLGPGWLGGGKRSGTRKRSQAQPKTSNTYRIYQLPYRALTESGRVAAGLTPTDIAQVAALGQHERPDSTTQLSCPTCEKETSDAARREGREGRV